MKAFTLIELLVVIGLAGLLLALSATVTIPDSKPKADTVFEQFYQRARLEALARQADIALGFDAESTSSTFRRKMRIFARQDDEWAPITSNTLPAPWRLDVERSYSSNTGVMGDIGFFPDSDNKTWLYWQFSDQSTPSTPHPVITLSTPTQSISYQITQEGALISNP